MKRRTTITLTIAGLLTMAGMLYAVTAIPFAFDGPPGVQGPLGVAAAPADLFMSDYCNQPDLPARTNINKVNCDGTFSVYATIPSDQPNNCFEKYMALAPLVSASATPVPFTPRDLFVTDGNKVWKVTPGNATLFAVIPDADCTNTGGDTGITFDHVGTFDYNIIVTCNHSGSVWKIDGAGSPTLIATTGTEQEGPAVVPAGFGPFGGQIWVGDEVEGGVVAISNTGTVTHSVVNQLGAEGVQVIPTAPCTFCPAGALPPGAYFQAITNFGVLYKYLPTDFVGLGGDVIVTTEGGFGAIRVHWNGTNYVNSFFDNIIGGGYEGSSFVDCDVPTPTPTPTATFTPTPTATFTPTPTPTPTVTPTSCGSSFVIGDLDAVVGHHVTFWGAQWWKLNHLSGGRAPASFKGFANCTNPNPPTCGGTWQSDPGNSSHPPDTVPADMTVIVSSLITKSGPIESGDIPMMVTIHTDPGYSPNPGHEGTGTVTAVVCGSAPQHRPPGPRR